MELASLQNSRSVKKGQCMAYFTDTVNYSTTGTKNITGVGFRPFAARFTISQRTSGTETSVSHLSTGFADGTVQRSHSTYADASGFETRRSASQCITHLERVAGTVTKVLAGTLTSFGADGITLNISTASGNYNIDVELFG